MDDLIREIVEAFEAARVEYNEDATGQFLQHILEAVRDPCMAYFSMGFLANHLTPVLEKHIKPDRIDVIAGLLKKLEEPKFIAASVWITFYPDKSGNVFSRRDGMDRPQKRFGFGVTPEDAIRSLLPDESAASSLSEQLTAGNSIKSVLEIGSQRFKVMLVPEKDSTRKEKP